MATIGAKSPVQIGREPGSSPWNNVVSFIELHRRKSPERGALIWSTHGQRADSKEILSAGLESMTFAELAAQSESLAGGLARLGLRAGDRIFLLLPMSPSLYVAILAVQRLGAIAVFIDSWACRSELGRCAAQVAPRALIGSEAAFRMIQDDPGFDSAQVEVIAGSSGNSERPRLEDLVRASESFPVAAVEGGHTALVTFTTGSSGEPKGANRTHRFLAAQHNALNRCLPYAPNDVDLPVFPIFSLNNLAGGVTTVLPAIDLSRPSETDGEVILEQMLATGTTTCTLSPSLLRAASSAACRRNLSLHGLRRCASGGAPVSLDDVAACRKMAPSAEVHLLYGSTEVEPIAHIAYSPAEFKGEDDEGVCVGTIAAGLEHHLVRLTREPILLGDNGWEDWEVSPGSPGELVVAGEHVCAGYYRNPEAFSRSKIRDENGRVWHRTGDVCRIDSPGRLWIIGRVHNAIRRGNSILYPIRPEIAMKRIPFVETAAYLGLPDAELGERACAVFTTRPGVSSHDAFAAVRMALQSERIPVDELKRVDAIPLDPRHHSKVEYAVLREQLMSEKCS